MATRDVLQMLEDRITQVSNYVGRRKKHKPTQDDQLLLALLVKLGNTYNRILHTSKRPNRSMEGLYDPNDNGYSNSYGYYEELETMEDSE